VLTLVPILNAAGSFVDAVEISSAPVDLPVVSDVSLLGEPIAELQAARTQKMGAGEIGQIKRDILPRRRTWSLNPRKLPIKLSARSRTRLSSR